MAWRGGETTERRGRGGKGEREAGPPPHAHPPAAVATAGGGEPSSGVRVAPRVAQEGDVREGKGLRSAQTQKIISAF
jgi:hypothetical protein